MMTMTQKAGTYDDSLNYSQQEATRRKQSKVVAPAVDLWSGLEKSRYGLVKRVVDPTTGFNVKALRFQVEEIPPGKHNGKHRHKDEVVIHVVQGKGHTIIEDKRLDWAESDTMFVPPWFWYQHFNDDHEKPVRFVIWSSGVLTEALGLSEFELVEEANY